MESKTTKAELAEAVRELREEVARLRAERPVHHCHSACLHAHCNWGHCGCFTWHGYGTTTLQYPATVTLPNVTYGTVTTNTAAFVGAASGYNPALTTSFVSN